MRGLGVLALATGLVGLGAAPALAAEPERTAWYSAATVGGMTVPAPTVAEGDLRVSGVGASPTAYATLLLSAPGASGGELVLAVRAGSAVGTPEVSACPTKTPTWEAGGNQPFEKGPGYDCAAGSVFGSVSADGTSISFPLDSSLQSAPGSFSIALAPLTEGTTPFDVVLGDPAFTPAEPDAPAASAPDPAGSPAPGGGQGVAEAPPLSPGLDAGVPAAPAVQDAPAPELAGIEAAPAAPAVPAETPAPETAAPPAAPSAVLPGAQLAAARTDTGDDAGPRLLALLALVGVSAGAGYAAGQQRPAPRLLGGRSRQVAAVPALVVPEPDAPLPRGIGRFSRVRDSAPRRLR